MYLQYWPYFSFVLYCYPLCLEMLFSRGVNCGRTAGRIEMPLGKNFRRPQIFSLEISGPKVAPALCEFSLYPCRGPGPEASASPASWMIRPWLLPIGAHDTSLWRHPATLSSKRFTIIPFRHDDLYRTIISHRADTSKQVPFPLIRRLHTSIFNHCDRQSYRIRWNNAK